MMLNVVKMVLLAAIVLSTTKVIPSAHMNPTVWFSVTATILALLAGVGLGFDVAAILLVIAIINTKSSVESYRAGNTRKAAPMSDGVVEEEEAPAEEPENTGFIVKTDDEPEMPLEEVQELPLETPPEVDNDDMAIPPPPLPVVAADETEECIPEFIVSRDMLRAAQNNVVSPTNANLFPNETKDPNINIQGLFTDISGYNGTQQGYGMYT